MSGDLLCRQCGSNQLTPTKGPDRFRYFTCEDCGDAEPYYQTAVRHLLPLQLLPGKVELFFLDYPHGTTDEL